MRDLSSEMVDFLSEPKILFLPLQAAKQARWGIAYNRRINLGRWLYKKMSVRGVD